MTAGSADLEALAHAVGVLVDLPPSTCATAGEWARALVSIVIAYPLLAGILLAAGGPS